MSDREPNNDRCPKLDTNWYSADMTEWVSPCGWQGGYVWLWTVWGGPRLWAYDEFWDWVKDVGAKIRPNPAVRETD